MKRRIAAIVWVLPLALSLVAAAPARAQQQAGGSPIDDLLKRAQDAFNDLQYNRADSLARQVLAIGPRITASQRVHALMVIAAASYPEEVSAQKRAVALATLKQIVRTNLGLKLPQELTWAGLDSLADEAKRTTYGIELSGESQQVLVGPEGTAVLRVRGSRPGSYQLTIVPTAGGSAAVFDSLPVSESGEFRFSAMRGERPIFSSGDYAVIVTGVDTVAHDTVTVRYAARVDAPPLEFLNVSAKMDSSKLLPERTGRAGMKSILPAVMVGAGAFAFSSALRADVIKDSVSADSKGMAVGGVLMVSALIAGYLDKGRIIPANVAANRTYAQAFQKNMVDAQAENRRRIAEYRTTIRLDLEIR